jgi:hypothetical protein
LGGEDTIDSSRLKITNITKIPATNIFLPPKFTQSDARRVPNVTGIWGLDRAHTGTFEHVGLARRVSCALGRDGYSERRAVPDAVHTPSMAVTAALDKARRYSV